MSYYAMLGQLLLIFFVTYKKRQSDDLFDIALFAVDVQFIPQM